MANFCDYCNARGSGAGLYEMGGRASPNQTGSACEIFLTCATSETWHRRMVSGPR